MAEEQKYQPTFSQSQIRDGIMKQLGISPAPQPPKKLNKTLGFLNRRSPVTQTITPSQTEPGGE